MKLPSSDDIAKFITSKAKKALVGKKCLFLDYGGGCHVDWTNDGKTLFAGRPYTHEILDVSFNWTSLPDRNGGYGSEPSYDMFLTCKRISDGLKTTCEVSITDVL